jgi:hypothetical protein
MHEELNMVCNRVTVVFFHDLNVLHSNLRHNIEVIVFPQNVRYLEEREL